MTPKAGNQVVTELLTKFPNAASKTIARIAYGDHPECWSTLDACRSTVRYLRGRSGRNAKATMAANPFVDKKPPSTISFSRLPPGLKQLVDWQAEPLDDVGVWMVLSDVHVPYHDAEVIKAVWRQAKKRKIVGILLNGDIMDNFAISRWEKDPRQRDFKNEIDTTKKFFHALREAFPKTRIVWKAGNHELRYQQYMRLKSPELLGIGDFELPKIAGSAEHGITYFDDNRPMKLGKLWVIHGHEYKFAISNPVNPARGLFLRAKVSALCGHLHQSSSHSEKDMADHIVSCWSTGCLCDLRPEYAPFNKWNHGAAFVEVSSDGAFSVNNFRIIDGKVFN